MLLYISTTVFQCFMSSCPLKVHNNKENLCFCPRDSFNAALLLWPSTYMLSTFFFSFITPHPALHWVSHQWHGIHSPAAEHQTCRKCSGGHRNWRACPQFLSIVWTKWVKLGSSSTKHRDSITWQWYFSQAQLLSLMCGNCLTWDAVLGLQAAKTRHAYQ